MKRTPKKQLGADDPGATSAVRNDMFSAVWERSSDAIWFVRPDGGFVDVNQAALDTYGYRRSEFLRMNVRDVRHPSALATFQDQLSAASVDNVCFETIHVKKDGTHFPVEVRSSRADVDGEHLILAIVRDISNRTTVDAQDRAEKLFSLFMQHLPGLAWVKDIKGRYVYVNDAAETAFQVSRENLYGKTDENVFPAEIANQFIENDERALAERAGLQTVETLKHGDGLLHHSIVSKFPISNGDGKVTLIGGMAIDITARISAEEALRESEERRQLAQEAGNVGIFDWDIAAGKTYWSETMWSFYGESPTNINPDEDYWSSHLHVNDRERVKLNVRQVVSSGEDTFRDEFRIVRKDGTTRWIGAAAKVVRDASGTALRMYGVNIDITERKEAEDRIRLSENQLRLVTGTVPALISYVDRDERYRFVNTKFTEWLGSPASEMVGRKVRDVLGAKIYRVLKPHILKALSGEEVSFEALLNYSKVGERYVQASYVPDIGVDGSVHGYYGLTHDMTDLKRSEALLRSSEERLGLLMESFTDYAIFSMDPAGRIDSWNRGAENIFGYSEDEILGVSCEILFTPEDIANGVPEKELRNARRKGRASDDRWHLRKDGTRFYASGVMAPLYVGTTLTGYAKIASDLTEKKRLAEELQQAHDELEVRVKKRTRELAETNIALIEEMEEREIAEKQRIELLRRLVTSQESERRRIARDIHDQLGQRLTALRLKIASLKEFSAGHEEFSTRVGRLQEIAERLDSEVSFLAWELRPTALDDLGLVDAVGTFVNEWSRHYEIPADFHSANLQNIRMFPEMETHLYRITQEALNNIAKHANAGRVSVLLEKRNEEVILIVEDDGAGFDTDGDAPGEARKGLGLVGMGERAVLVGGNVEIESAPGRGTTIYVRMPISI